MQKVLSFLMVAALTTTTVFAASGDPVVPPVAPVVPQEMTAAPVAAKSQNLGENKSVSCASNSAYGTNSCDACFDGGSVTVGKRLTGLFDNWTNNTTGILIAYQSEQKNPNMVAFGSTTWTSSPADESKLWKSSSDIIWSPAQTGSTKMQYMLPAGQKIKFIEADAAAGYTLTKTDRKNGELIGMMKYPIVAHAFDTALNTEGPAKTHYECVAYTLSAPVVTPAPAPVTPTTPVTPEITKTATGPAETIILILAAFFIAFGLMFSLRKRI